MSLKKILTNIICAFVPSRRREEKFAVPFSRDFIDMKDVLYIFDDKPYIFAREYQRIIRQSSSLNNYENNIYSQHGEDGILAHIFDIIKPKTKYAIEFGAWDGRALSNVFNLVENFGWQALMIEGNTKRYSALQATAEKVQGRIIPIQGIVGFEGGGGILLDAYLAENHTPEIPDILSIDVDGIDYFIWESLKNYRPRVVVIEFNPTIPAEILFVQARNEFINEGSSAAALVKLANDKGYSLAAVVGGNLIFVNNEEAPLLGIEDNSLNTLWEWPPPGRIFQGYNGKIYTAGMPRLGWQDNINIRIAPDALQLLDKFEWFDALPRPAQK
jgi:hypothetical protein